MNMVLLSYFVLGVMVGIVVTMIVLVSIIEHYDRMEDYENEAD